MSRLALLAPAALLLALAGCAPGGGTGGTNAPSPDPTPAPEEPTASAIVLSLEGLATVDQDGEPLEAVRFDDAPPVLVLLTELLGEEPEEEYFADYGTTTYSWGEDVQLWTNEEDFSRLSLEVAELGGLPVATTDGITIGSTRDEVLALDPYDGEYDVDGDGDSDFLGLEPVANPEYESLSFPGQPGTDFIEVQLEDDLVSSLRSPSNDYTDV